MSIEHSFEGRQSTTRMGVRRIVASTPSGTSLTALHTCPATMNLTNLYSVNIAAISAADVTVVYNDGSTDYSLLSAKTMAADEVILLEWREGLPFRASDVLKIKTTSGSAITFVAVIEEVPRIG